MFESRLQARDRVGVIPGVSPAVRRYLKSPGHLRSAGASVWRGQHSDVGAGAEPAEGTAGRPGAWEGTQVLWGAEVGGRPPMGQVKRGRRPDPRMWPCGRW